MKVMYRISRTELILVSIVFQSLWLIAVIGQESGLIVLGTALILAGIGLWRYRMDQFRLGIRIFAIGVLLDVINTAAGLFVFDTSTTLVGLPIWLVALWCCFGSYAGYVGQVLSAWPRLWSLSVGGASGAGSYYAGMQLDAVKFGYPVWLSVCVLIIEWGVMTYVILKIQTNQAVY
jgi:hypothetical protein